MRALRLLPLLIFAVVLMLGARAGDVFLRLAESGPVPAAEAQEAAPPAAAPAVEERGGDEEEPPRDLAAAAPGPRGAALSRDLVEMSDAEIAVLQQLAARREEIERRAEALELRETVLAVAEQRLAEKIARLEELNALVDRKLDAYDSQRDEKLKSLVKIYETMKPKDAARIFDELEMDVLIEVLARMREQKSAAVLAQMDALRAKNVTTELALRQGLPELAGFGGAAAPPVQR